MTKRPLYTKNKFDFIGNV